MLKAIKNFWTGEEGATMVEYAIMLALIAIVCIVVVAAIGTSAKSVFSDSASALGATS